MGLLDRYFNSFSIFQAKAQNTYGRYDYLDIAVIPPATPEYIGCRILKKISADDPFNDSNVEKLVVLFAGELDIQADDRFHLYDKDKVEVGLYHVYEVEPGELLNNKKLTNKVLCRKVDVTA